MLIFRKTYTHFYKEVFERYSQMIFSFVREKVGDRVDALDIAQEVFLHLWKYRKKIRQNEEDKGIIIKACRQEIYRFYKGGFTKWQSQAIPLSNVESYLIDDSNEQLELKMEKEKLLEELYAALELIPARRKDILLRNKLEGKTRNEIASEMRMSTSAIGNQIDKAMQFLRNTLRRSS